MVVAKLQNWIRLPWWGRKIGSDRFGFSHHKTPHKMSQGMFEWDDGMRGCSSCFSICPFCPWWGHMSLPDDSVATPEVLAGWHHSLLPPKKKKKNRGRMMNPKWTMPLKEKQMLVALLNQTSGPVEMDGVIWRAEVGPRLSWLHAALPASPCPSYPTLYFSSWQISGDFCSPPFSRTSVQTTTSSTSSDFKLAVHFIETEDLQTTTAFVVWTLLFPSVITP